MSGPDLRQRAAAAQETKDAAKDKRFKLGKQDCFLMVRAHLVRMGAAVAEFGNVGSYHSPTGARRKLQRAGYADLHAAMDAHFVRIPPAAALIGDVIALEGEEGVGALTVYLGNGRVLGFHETSEFACILQPNAYEAAWRIIA